MDREIIVVVDHPDERIGRIGDVLRRGTRGYDLKLTRRLVFGTFSGVDLTEGDP